MSTTPLLRYPILQHAYFVTDIEEGCRQWTRTTGAGPFFVTRAHVGDRHTYRGQPSDTPFDYAFGQSGPTHVQLIGQAGDEPSIYRDMFAPGDEGLHHVACLVPDDDLEAECARYEAAGFPVASTLWSLANVAYIDTRPAIGCFLELHGDNEAIRAVFDRFKSAHDEWDGVTDPIRGNR